MGLSSRLIRHYWSRVTSPEISEDDIAPLGARLRVLCGIKRHLHMSDSFPVAGVESWPITFVHRCNAFSYIVPNMRPTPSSQLYRKISKAKPSVFQYGVSAVATSIQSVRVSYGLKYSNHVSDLLPPSTLRYSLRLPLHPAPLAMPPSGWYTTPGGASGRRAPGLLEQTGRRTDGLRNVSPVHRVDIVALASPPSFRCY